MSLDNIRIVLVRTYHAGNIGSAVRSMKTMGLSDLYLVSPRDFPSPEANKMSAGAESMLSTIKVVETLEQAISDCTVIVASTVRPRTYDLPELNPEQTANLLLEGASNSPVALIFGPERMGLHNEDIKLAKYRVTIPANPEYNSLNMAAAVQTLSYEIYKASLNTKTAEAKASRTLPSSEDVERLFVHLEKVLKDIQFLRPHQGETMLRLRNLLNRAEPDVLETSIIRGILTAIEKSLQGSSD